MTSSDVMNLVLSDVIFTSFFFKPIISIYGYGTGGDGLRPSPLHQNRENMTSRNETLGRYRNLANARDVSTFTVALSHRETRTSFAKSGCLREILYRDFTTKYTTVFGKSWRANFFK